MKYDTLLIDIDNTLLNFKAAEDVSFVKLLEDLKIPYSDDLKDHYLSINHQLWKDYEEGTIEKDVISDTRFARSLEAYPQAQKYTGLELDEMFRRHLEENNIFMEGALEMLREVKDDYRLVIVTNGISETQYRRLTNAEIVDYFELIVVSSDTGYTKPHQGFFDYTFERIDDVNLEKTIILGDSLSADIQGGLNAGIATCWYNPYEIENKTGITPRYEIHNLRDFVNIVTG